MASLRPRRESEKKALFAPVIIFRNQCHGDASPPECHNTSGHRQLPQRQQPLRMVEPHNMTLDDALNYPMGVHIVPVVSAGGWMVFDRLSNLATNIHDSHPCGVCSVRSSRSSSLVVRGCAGPEVRFGVRTGFNGFAHRTLSPDSRFMITQLIICLWTCLNIRSRESILLNLARTIERLEESVPVWSLFSHLREPGYRLMQPTCTRFSAA